MADGFELDVGHEGEGSDCIGKTIRMGGQGAVAGALIGTVESCFLPQQPRSTTPLLFKALNLIGRRGVQGGAVLGTFAAATCITANVRDRNDFVNPFIGGCLSGSIFGILARSIPLTLGISLGTGVVMAIIKYRHGTYFPPLPWREATSQNPLPWTNEGTSTSSNH